MESTRLSSKSTTAKSLSGDSLGKSQMKDSQQLSTAKMTSKHLTCSMGSETMKVSTTPKNRAIRNLIRDCTHREGGSHEFDSLTKAQRKVMEYIAEKSEMNSSEAKRRLKTQWAHLGISSGDFTAIEKYLLARVPMTIRVSIAKLFPYLLSDPFYRSIFETRDKGDAYLQYRREWERSLFNGIYETEGVEPKEKPKYGVLNMVCNPYSDTRLLNFGSAYFLLKDELRVRITVATSKENSPFERKVGTINNMWHVIETLSQHEIIRLHAVATKKRSCATVTPDSKYSEIQVHGMLDVRKDVAAVVVQKEDYKFNSNIRALVDAFSKLYIIPIITSEELDELLESNGWATVMNAKANILYQKTMGMGNTNAFISSSRW